MTDSEMQDWIRSVERGIKSEIRAAEHRMIGRVAGLEDRMFKGNGSPPLMTRMALLEVECAELRSQDRRKGNRFWDTAKIILAASLAVVLAKYV